MVRNKCEQLLKWRALLDEKGRAASKGPAVIKYLAAQMPAIRWQAHCTQQLSRVFICSIWPVMGSEK